MTLCEQSMKFNKLTGFNLIHQQPAAFRYLKLLYGQIRIQKHIPVQIIDNAQLLSQKMNVFGHRRPLIDLAFQPAFIHRKDQMYTEH